RAAVEAGASIVNDVTGRQGDKEMIPLVAESKAAFIIMHMQGVPLTMQIAPHYIDVVSEVADFFRQQYACALQCGIDPMAIAFDPGIGFGKTLEHNLELLAQLERIRVHERPLVVGISRKSLLSRDARRQSVDRAGDRFLDADVDFSVAQSGCDRLARAKFFGFPGGRIGGDLPTGAASWPGRARRASNLLPNARKTRNCPRSCRGSEPAGEQTIRRSNRD